MIVIHGIKLSELSFPDFFVSKITIDPYGKSAEIFTDGAMIEGKEIGLIELGQGKLVIKRWQKISIKAYNAGSSGWDELEVMGADKLKDVCEVEFGDDIVLRGFGFYSGAWTECKFVKPEIMYAEYSQK